MIKQQVFFSVIFLILFSCSKKQEETPAPSPASPAIGYWIGSYTTIGQLGSANYAMLLQAGGVGRVYELGQKTDTTLIAASAKVNAVWTLNGNTVQTTYSSGSKTINTIATLNAANTQMSGTWAFDAVVKGNISLAK